MISWQPRLKGLFLRDVVNITRCNGLNGSLLDAGNFVKTIIERYSLQVGSPDEVAFQMKWITIDDLKNTVVKFSKNKYGDYLLNLARGSK